MFLHEKLLKAHLHSLPEGETKILLSQVHSALAENRAEIAYIKLRSLLDPGAYHAFSEQVRLCICLRIPFLIDYWLNRIEQLRVHIANVGFETPEDKNNLDEYELKVRGLYDAVKEVDKNPPPRYWIPQLNQLSAESRLIFTAVLADTLCQHRRYLPAVKKYRQILMYSPELRNRAQKVLLILDAFDFSTQTLETRLAQINDYFIAEQYVSWADYLFHEAVTESNQLKSVEPFIKLFKTLAPFLEYWLAQDQRETVRKILIIIRNEKGNLRESYPDNFFDLTHPYVGETSFHRLEAKIDSKEALKVPDSPYPNRLDHHRSVLRSFKQTLIADTFECKNLDEFPGLQQRSSSYIRGCLSLIIEDVTKLLIQAPCDSAVVATGSIARGTFAPGSDIDLALLIKHKKFQTHLYFRLLVSLLNMRLLCLGNDSLEIDEGDVIGVDADNPTHIGTPEDLFKRYHPVQMLPESHVADRNHTLIYAQLRPILLFITEKPLDEHNSGLKLFEEYTGLVRSAITSSQPVAEAKEEVKGESSPAMPSLGKRLAVLYFQKHSEELIDIVSDSKDAPEINFKKHHVAPLVFCCTNLALYFSLTHEGPTFLHLSKVRTLTDSIVVIYRQLSKRLDKDYCAQLKNSLSKLQSLQVKFQTAWHEYYGQHNLSAVNMIYNSERAKKIGAHKSLYLTPEEETELNEIHELLIKPTYSYMSKLKVESTQLPLQADLSLEEITAHFKLIQDGKVFSEAEINTAFEYLIKLIYHRYKLGIYNADSMHEMLLKYYLKLPQIELKKRYLYIAIQQAKDDKHIIDWVERLLLPNGESRMKNKESDSWLIQVRAVFNEDDFILEMVSDSPVPAVSLCPAKPAVSGGDEVKAADTVPKITLKISEDEKLSFYVSPQELTKVFDQQGELLEEKGQTQKHRRVFRLKDKHGTIVAYLKIFPEIPGNQLIVDYLSWAVGGYGALSKLVALQVEITGKKTVYPVLLSKPAHYNLKQVIDNELDPKPQIPSLKAVEANLCAEAFTSFVLVSLWINPEDEQWKNIGVEDEFLAASGKSLYRLIRFDGDHAFVDELGHRQVSFFTTEKVANVKSAVFCLDAMKNKLNKTAVLRFLTIDIGALLERVLIELDAYNQLVNQTRGGMFTEQAISAWKDKKESFIPGLITPNLLQWLFYRGQYIKGYLFKAYQANALFIMHNELRDALLPQVAVHYKKAWGDQTFTPVQRFKQLPTNYERPSTSSVQPILQESNYQSSLSTRAYLAKMEKDWQTWITKKSHEQLVVYLKKFIQGYRSLEEGMGADASEWVLFLRRLLEMITPTPSTAKVDLLEQLSKVDSLEGFQTLHQLDLRPHAEFVTDNIFSQLISRLPHLKKLDISGCTHLTINLFSTLHNTSIKHLIAKQYQQDIHTLITLFHFPELETLVLDESLRLKELDIRAPKLKFLSLLGCPNVAKQTFGKIHTNSPGIKRLLISHSEELRTLQGNWLELEELVIEDGNLKRVQIKALKLRKLSLRGNKQLTYVNTNSQALVEVNFEGCMLLTPEGIAGHLMDGRFAHLLTVCTLPEKDTSDWIKLREYQHTYPTIAWLWLVLECNVWDKFSEEIKVFVGKYKKQELATVVRAVLPNHLVAREQLSKHTNHYLEMVRNACQTLKKFREDKSVEYFISYFGPKLPLDEQIIIIDILLQDLNQKNTKVNDICARILSHFNLTSSTKYKKRIIEALTKKFEIWSKSFSGPDSIPSFVFPNFLEALAQYRTWMHPTGLKSIVFSIYNRLLSPPTASPLALEKCLSKLSDSLDSSDKIELILKIFNLLFTQSGRVEEISNYLQHMSSILQPNEGRHLLALLIRGQLLETPKKFSDSKLDLIQLEVSISFKNYSLFLLGLKIFNKYLTVAERWHFILLIMQRIQRSNDYITQEELICLQALSTDIKIKKHDEIAMLLIKYLQNTKVKCIDSSQPRDNFPQSDVINVLGAITKNCSPELWRMIFNELMYVIERERNISVETEVMNSILQFIQVLSSDERVRLVSRMVDGICSATDKIREATPMLFRACRSELTDGQRKKLISHLIKILNSNSQYIKAKKVYAIQTLEELSPDFSLDQNIRVIAVVVVQIKDEDHSLQTTAIKSITALCFGLPPAHKLNLLGRLKNKINGDAYQKNLVKVLFEFCKSYGFICSLSARVEVFNWLLNLLTDKSDSIQLEAIEAFGNFGSFMAELPTEVVDQLATVLISRLTTLDNKNWGAILGCLGLLSTKFSFSRIINLVQKIMYLLESERIAESPFLISYLNIEVLVYRLGIISQNFAPSMSHLVTEVLDNLIKMYNSNKSSLKRLYINHAMLEVHKNAGLNTISTIMEHKPQEEKKDDAKSIVTTLPLDASLPPITLSAGLSAALSTTAVSAAAPSSPDLKKLMAQWLTYSVQHLNFRELRLQTQAKQYGFDCHNVNKDGNCLFHAVAHQINITHDELRQRTTEHMLENLHLYKQFSEKDPDTLINEIMTPGSWADDIFIRALSRALNITIAIIRSDGRDPTIFRRNNPLATIYLGYEVGVHYQSLIRQSSQEEKSQNNIDDYINRTAVDEWEAILPKAEKEKTKPPSQLFFPIRPRAKSLDISSKEKTKPQRRMSLH